MILLQKGYKMKKIILFIFLYTVSIIIGSNDTNNMSITYVAAQNNDVSTNINYRPRLMTSKEYWQIGFTDVVWL